MVPLSRPTMRTAKTDGHLSPTSQSRTLISYRVSCYCHDTADLEIKNIPDTLHERLRHHARENGCTMRAVVLTAIERELARRAWRKCLDERPETDLGVEAVTLLMEERKRRDKQLG